MTEIIGVRFKSGGKQYYFDPKGVQVRPGQGVIIETSRGIEYGDCVQGNTMVEDSAVVQPLRPMVRIATEKDLENIRRNKEKEARAFRICQEKIAAHGLEMKLVEVEYNFDGSKILFFFTSEGRVDFRALVKDLAGVFHTRIELRQIGVRDEAKMLGGLGICGRPFCCCGFMDEFQPVSIKMAKTQGLSLNPTKISGTCGRLMCCLKYEQAAYEDAVKRMPKNESFVETPDGVGTVSQVDLLRETVKVRLEDEPEAPKCYHNCELCVVRNGKGKRPEGYVAPPPEELAKLRRPADPAAETEEDRLSAALASLSGLSDPTPDRKPQRERRRPSRPGNGNGGNSGGRPPKGQQAPAEGQSQPRKPRPPKPRNDRPAPKSKDTREVREDRPAPAPQNAPASKPADPAPEQEGGAPKKPRRRWRRPRGNKPKGESGTPPKAE
ncbi:stage 0 sporulation family protein [Pseudoflavonifractor sp. MSJ-37]|uniref:PSP1 domain-containing protein n=1 Tax=Pseudoflavonifractor sp. MSJ-37 TaxID=2841531 RepID=UPI001C114CA6|nr:stage 0 sporulation family protein [Pseudoflavonifractor sp. MSJ-37]MBU5435386.1 stage 0 sporulation family protein [Pseudoflavonifractor sp. MSJ-37]